MVFRSKLYYTQYGQLCDRWDCSEGRFQHRCVVSGHLWYIGRGVRNFSSNKKCSNCKRKHYSSPKEIRISFTINFPFEFNLCSICVFATLVLPSLYLQTVCIMFVCVDLGIYMGGASSWEKSCPTGQWNNSIAATRISTFAACKLLWPWRKWSHFGYGMCTWCSG